MSPRNPPNEIKFTHPVTFDSRIASYNWSTFSISLDILLQDFFSKVCQSCIITRLRWIICSLQTSALRKHPECKSSAQAVSLKAVERNCSISFLCLICKKSLQSAIISYGTTTTNLATSGHGASWITSGIVWVFALVVLGLSSSGVNAGTNVSPSTVVQRLLLSCKISKRLETNSWIAPDTIADLH